VKPSHLDRLADGSDDTAHLISVADKNFFSHIGDHEIVLGD
jgi:hypothetical protein